MLNVFHNKHDNIFFFERKNMLPSLFFLMEWSYISTNQIRTNEERESEKDRNRKLEKKRKGENEEKLKEG